MSHATQMSYGQVLDVAAWQQARRREFLPMKLFVVTGSLAVAQLMGTLCAGWFAMLLLGADREAILTELTGATYFAYWQARHGAGMAAQAGAIWQGGVLGYGVWLLPWSAIAILSFWPTLRRNETLVAERDPLPLPDSTIPVPPALSTTADRVRNPSPPTEVGTLITASKPSKPDRLHDLNVLRMMRVANERTVRELGALPAGGLPVMTKQKASHLPPSWRRHIADVSPELEAALAHEENGEMKWTQVAATAALAAGMASGCTDGSGSRWHELPREPEYRLNPNPKEKYELTVSIANAPGPLILLGASTIYYAPDCAYMVDRWAGASGQPQHGLLIELTQTSATTWRGTFYRDAMLDEDYDGPQGTMLPCHWRLQYAGVTFTATGAPLDTRYDADMSNWPEGEWSLERTQIKYYTKNTYPSSPFTYPSSPSKSEPWSDHGRTERPNLPEEEVFTITLTTRRAQP